MTKIRSTESQARERIFDAAAQVFEEKGYSGARMQEIADRAGMNKALLHYYFRSKAELFRAVFEVLQQKMFEKTLAILGQDISFIEKVEKFLDEHTEFIIKNPRLPLFLLNEMAQDPGLAENLKEAFRFADLRKRVWDQHAEELRGYGLSKGDVSQLLVTIVSFSVFPAAGRNMISLLLPELAENRNFGKFMRERKRFAKTLLFSSLKNRIQ